MSPFDVGDDFPDSRTNSFEEEEDDKDHGVPNVPTGPITRSKTEKIQQAFILYLQNWIDSVQSLFHVLQADSIEEEGPFGALEVNISMVEVADEIAITST